MAVSTFLFSHALKLRGVALIPTSSSTSHFWFEVRRKNLDQGGGIHSIPGSLVSFGRAESLKSWGDSVSLQGRVTRGAEPLLRLLLYPLGSSSCSPPAFDQLLGMCALPQGL